MNSERTSTTRLTEVVIRSTDLDHDIGVFAAITGTAPTSAADGATALTDRAAFVVGGARLTLLSNHGDDGSRQRGSIQRGIKRLVIDVADLDAAYEALRAAAADAKRNGKVVQISREWAGVHVELRASTAEHARPSHPAGAVLDHVAILVADVELMTGRWATIIGSPPAHAGIHPLGTSIAARFILDDRMIELLAPLPDTASALHTRLDRYGPGPFALAIIANDLDATITAIADAGARLIDQPPHIVVHPSDASGVPIQITPRVHH